MTRLAALRSLLSRPRDHVDQGRIGRRVLWSKADGREKLSHCVRVLRSVIRKAS